MVASGRSVVLLISWPDGIPENKLINRQAKRFVGDFAIINSTNLIVAFPSPQWDTNPSRASNAGRQLIQERLKEGKSRGVSAC